MSSQQIPVPVAIEKARRKGFKAEVSPDGRIMTFILLRTDGSECSMGRCRIYGGLLDLRTVVLMIGSER